MKIYIHGNCQAPVLHRLIGDAMLEWEVHSYEVFGDRIIQDLEHYRQIIRTSDAIISQNIWHGYRKIEELSTHWISENKKIESKLITIPSLFFRGMHPLIFYLRENGADVQNLGMPYHDLSLLFLLTQGMRKDRAISLMCSPELYTEQFVMNEFNIALDELRRREKDDHLNVKISAWLAVHGANRQLFHAINHPTREMMAFVANAVMELIGTDRRVSVDGPDDLRLPHIPPAPSVLRHLSGGKIEHAGQFVIANEKDPISMRDYYSRSIEMMAGRSLSSIGDIIASEQESAAFLNRFRRDGSGRFS